MEKELMVVEPCDLKVPAHEYQHLVEQGLKTLSVLERQALHLRFWQILTITEVADRMGLSWEGADHLIDLAVAKVRRVMRRRLEGPGRGDAV